MTDLEHQLRKSIQFEQMRTAIEEALPKMRAHYNELNMAALASGRELDMVLANSWLSSLMMCEHALQEARGKLTLRRQAKSQVVEMGRRAE
jgi:hypothetical protein